MQSYRVIDDLKDTAASLKNCAGLAAPQIGHQVRIILVHVQGAATIMINPVIAERRGKQTYSLEGCFSIPDTIKKPVPVKRSFKVCIGYYDEFGKHVSKKYKGFEARLIQHEIDHLDGTLIA